MDRGKYLLKNEDRVKFRIRREARTKINGLVMTAAGDHRLSRYGTDAEVGRRRGCEMGLDLLVGRLYIEPC